VEHARGLFRSSLDQIPKEAARIAYLAKHYNRSADGIRTILRRASKSPRAIDRMLTQLRAASKKTPGVK